ncbi:limonene-1,2-epoxide hydrolase family protein [Mycolicibacterium murale]|uniref:limonene-1,2-epoxide hydrolase family protein n=1 Tax=Mycolicibacterium murale TaxID=182220 RepID=UPI00187537E2|nr:limonene-1,2-epoxide hydrolase family protein [Mycolicibacterium murale]MCV7183004.1 nuclear transport factor 2 family protein [Mycolicibacterium murale]
MFREFFGRWSISKAVAMAAFDEFFTPETVWENVGLVTTVGIEEAQALVATEPPGFETMIVDFKFIVSQGPYVFTERVDDFYGAAGELLMSARVAGVAEIRDGRIIVMREYFIPPAATSGTSGAATNA